MRRGLMAAFAILAFPLAADAQTVGRQAALATYQGKPYDVAANCLMKEMRGDQIVARPTLYAPPRTEAVVNIWQRGSEHGVPIGVFHIKQDQAGATTIGFEETQRGRLSSLARTAAERCAQ